MSETTETKKEILMEKLKTVAPDRHLGGVILESEGDEQTYKRVQQIIFCNVCGDKLEEKDQYAVCKFDGKVVCATCGVKYENKIMCLDCLVVEHPLSKEAYMVAVAIKNGISNIGKLHRTSKIPKYEVRELRNFLRREKLAVKDFLGAYQMTAKGIGLVNVYSKIYDPLKEVSDFKKEI